MREPKFRKQHTPTNCLLDEEDKHWLSEDNRRIVRDICYHEMTQKFTDGTKYLTVTRKDRYEIKIPNSISLEVRNQKLRSLYNRLERAYACQYYNFAEREKTKPSEAELFYRSVL